MKSINHLKPSILFALPPKEGGEPPCLTLLPLPEKKGEELEELVKRGVCNKYGEVSEPFSSVDLQTLDLKEAAPIFKEIFQKRESLLNQEHSLVIDMGHALGRLVKGMILKGDNNFHPCIQGDFVPYLLFHLLPSYAKREFHSLGVDLKSNESVILCPKSTLVGIECPLESSLETVMHVALKSLACTIRFYNPLCPKKITKDVVQRELVEGELFLERTMKFSSKGSLQERGFVHLRLKERPETVERAMNFSLFKPSRPQTFTANSLYIPLEEVLGLYLPQYNVNDLKFRCKPQSFDRSPLQAFLDCYFGFIRGPGNWFELISLYVRGFTSMEKDPFLEQRTFEKYYTNNPEKLAESILEELDKTYPNDPEFHLFFLLNASISLFENGKEREVEIFLEKTLDKLALDPNSNPALLLLVNLIKEEKIPFSLLLTFLQVTSFLMHISNQSDGEYSARLKSEERRRDVVLLRIGPHILRLPYKNSQPLYELYNQLVVNSSIENKLLQLFMLFYSIDPKKEVDHVNIVNFQVNKIADFFLEAPSYLLNGIGLGTKLLIREKLPPLHKITEVLTYLDLHYSGVVERLPLRTFICRVIESSIGELLVVPASGFTIVGSEFRLIKAKERAPEEKEKCRKTLDLISLFIIDLEDLKDHFWVRLYKAAAEVNMAMDLVPLWNGHVENYLTTSPLRHQVVNILLFGLKKSAFEGDEEASLYICNFFPTYFYQIGIDDTQLDLSIDDLFFFVTETFRYLKFDQRWIFTLTAMIQLLFTRLHNAQLPLPENERSALGYKNSRSIYLDYHVSFSIEYFDMLFAHVDLKTIREMSLLIGVEYLRVPNKYKGKIINLLCEEETLDELKFVLHVHRQIFELKKGDSILREKDFIPDIDYNKVIPFLWQFPSPERIRGTLCIWWQCFDLSLRGEVKVKKELVIGYGFSFIEYALQLKTQAHDLLITRLFQFMTKSLFWKEDKNLTLRYFTLLLRHSLYIQNPPLYIEFLDVIKLTLDTVKNLIVKQVVAQDDAICTILPTAIVKSVHYVVERFVEFAKAYWELNSLSTVLIFDKTSVKKMPYLSPVEYKMKKNFIEEMLKEISKTEKMSSKIEILKVLESSFSNLSKEIKSDPRFIKQREEELKALLLQVRGVLDLRRERDFDAMKSEIEAVLEAIGKREDKEGRVKLWKSAGYLLGYLKEEIGKNAESLKEKEGVLVDLDLKFKSAFSLLK